MEGVGVAERWEEEWREEDGRERAGLMRRREKWGEGLRE